MSNGLTKRKKADVIDIKAKYIETRTRELKMCAAEINASLERYSCQYQLSIPTSGGEKILLSNILVPTVVIDLVSK